MCPKICGKWVLLIYLKIPTSLLEDYSLDFAYLDFIGIKEINLFLWKYKNYRKLKISGELWSPSEIWFFALSLQIALIELKSSQIVLKSSLIQLRISDYNLSLNTEYRNWRRVKVNLPIVLIVVTSSKYVGNFRHRSIWNAKLTETRIFRELSNWIKELSNSIKEIFNSISELFNSIRELFNSIIELSLYV